MKQHSWKFDFRMQNSLKFPSYAQILAFDISTISCWYIVMQIKMKTDTIRNAEYPKIKDLTLNSDWKLIGNSPKKFASQIPAENNQKLWKLKKLRKWKKLTFFQQSKIWNILLCIDNHFIWSYPICGKNIFVDQSNKRLEKSLFHTFPNINALCFGNNHFDMCYLQIFERNFTHKI